MSDKFVMALRGSGLACAIAAAAGLLVAGGVGKVRAESEWRPFAETPRPKEKPAPTATDANSGVPQAQPAAPGYGEQPSPPRGAYAPAPGSPAAYGQPLGSAQPATSANSAPFGSPAPSVGQGTTGGYQPSLSPLPPLEESARGVERTELQSPLASDGSGLPLEIWTGLDQDKLDTRLAGLELPPRSPTLTRLWQKLMTAPSGAQGGKPSDRALAVRAEVLHRSGLIEAEGQALASVDLGASGDPVLRLLSLRSLIGLGEREKGCAAARAVMADRAKLPKPLLGEAILLSAYCAVASGNPDAAGLASELIRDAGIKAPNAQAALDVLVGGGPLNVPKLDKRVSLLDYRFLELIPGFDASPIVERAEPALVALLAKSEGLPAHVKLAASEAAVRLSLISPLELAGVYQAQSFQPDELADPASARVSASAHRALLFKLAQTERAPLRRTRLIRSLLDEARKAQLYLPTLDLVAPLVAQVPILPEVGWFSETAIVSNLVAGKFAEARAWVGNGSVGGQTGMGAGGREGLSHWFLLIDLAQPGSAGERGQALASAEDFARRGGFKGELLPKLATVLDALDYNVPIPLWDAANRGAQPTGGFMPPTGVLSELADAARQRHFARTVLAGLAALGPDGPERSNILPLGDTIRAFKRAGLEADARRLVVEALLPAWPQSVGN